jgi:hypothetical protein
MISVPVSAVEKLRAWRERDGRCEIVGTPGLASEANEAVGALIALLPPVPQWEPDEEQLHAMFMCDGNHLRDQSAATLRDLHDNFGLVLSPVSTPLPEGPEHAIVRHGPLDYRCTCGQTMKHASPLALGESVALHLSRIGGT